MTRAFSIGDAIGYGWRGLMNNLAPLVLIALVALLANGMVNLLQRAGGHGWFWTILTTVIATFVSLVISLGLIRAALAITDGRRPELPDLLSTDGIGVYLVASLLVSLIIAVGLVLLIIPGLIAGFLLEFYGYAIVDRRVDAGSSAANADPIGSMRASFEVVSRNFGQLLLFALACLGLNIFGALLCGVGLLVSLPVTAIALAYAWRYFSGGVIAPQP